MIIAVKTKSGWSSVFSSKSKKIPIKKKCVKRAASAPPTPAQTGQIGNLIGLEDYITLVQGYSLFANNLPFITFSGKILFICPHRNDSLGNV